MARDELFQSSFLKPSRRWRAFLASLLLHCGAVPLVPVLASLLPESENQIRRRAVVIRPLELHVDEHLYLPMSSPAPKRGPQRRAQARRSEPAPKPGARAVAKEEGSKPAPRRFELPQLARRVDSDQTILQPQFPPDLKIEQQVRLPNIMFWSAQKEKLPRPTPKRFVAPGREATTPPTPPNLDALPTLELPNREQTVTDLKISGLPVNENPALPRPRGTTMPLRVFSLPGVSAPQGVDIDAAIGDPINLLALSTNPAAPERVLIVPPGNQLGRLPGPPGEAAMGEGTGEGPGAGVGAGSASGGGSAGSGSGSGAGSGSGGTGAGGAGSGRHGSRGSGGAGGPPGAGGAAGTGGPPGAPGGAGGRGTGGEGTGIGGAGQGGGQVLALSSPPPALAASSPIRVVHPNTSVFDVVIQSTSSGVVPEASEILSGKPVYTVYLNLATKKDWLLQYCKPRGTERGPRAEGEVVHLGSAAPIRAPYLMVRATPPITLEPRATYLLVHGFLETTGRFKDLKMVRQSDARLEKQILPYLEEWEFRPGTQDGRPVLLEILLVIPPNEG